MLVTVNLSLKIVFILGNNTDPDEMPGEEIPLISSGPSLFAKVPVYLYAEYKEPYVNGSFKLNFYVTF